MKISAAQLAIREGDLLNVIHDDGSKHIHTAHSDPWQLAGGVWVIKLSGKSGGYSLERCKKMEVRPL